MKRQDLTLNLSRTDSADVTDSAGQTYLSRSGQRCRKLPIPIYSRFSSVLSPVYDSTTSNQADGGGGCLTPVRRSLDVDCLSLGSGSGSSSPSSSASSSLAASMLLLRPRAFARQLSDDLRRRRESYAAGQYGSNGGCYSPLATGVGVPSHRHSVGGLQLMPGNLVHSARLHSATASSAAASAANDGAEAEDGYNLQRIRSSALGQSAPSLTANSVRDLLLPRRCSRVQHHHLQHRKSMISATSPTMPPRCQSPLSQGSPMESPRNMSPSQQFAFVPIKKAECRRWSVASLPSSGYGTTPASSNVSSQCSSQERLNHLPTVPTAEEMRILSRHFSSNESNPVIEETDGAAAAGRHSPRMRPRSRSLSSPIRSPVVDSEVVMMNMLYKERFPKATRQMEERLKTFVEENASVESSEALVAAAEGSSEPIPADAIAIVRFVQHQVIELGRDCLQKSEQGLITSRYFYDMSDNLERLLNEAKDKAVDAVPHLSRLVRKLLLIISRPARLLECLEFDPEEFYHMLEEAEGQVKTTQGVTDFPQYIVTQLGLNRDPLAEFQQDLSQLEKTCSTPEPPTEGTDSPVTTSTPEKKKVADTSHLPKESDYEVVKLISNGAYGAVYLVRHRETRHRFAMKKINKRNLLLRNQIEQAFAERDILCFTDNPFVVSLQCSFETQRHLCMVMEYVEGGDCATLLKNMGPFPCDMARLYFAEMVLAVEYLHSYGIVHRDLKPDNLLITAMGHIKLTDFGLSKMGLMSLATNLYEGFIDRETREFSDKQVFGTPEYIAPEVVLRQGYGKPVDWWSSGIILYEFLIGCVPFFGETPEELFSHVVNDDIEWPSESDWPVPVEAKDLITALLQQNPRDRLGTAGGAEVKSHPFFDRLDWNSLLRQKAGFVPQLDDDNDTSYFDTRADRYCHDDASGDLELDLETTEGGATTPLFGSFSSCSPRYKKSHGLFLDAKSSNDSGSGASDQSESCGSLSAGEDKSLTLPPIQQTPESTENEDSSPQLQRRRRMLHRELKSLPRFSISVESESGGRCMTPISTPDHIRELSPVDEGDRTTTDSTPPTSAGIHLTACGGVRPKNVLTQSFSPNFKQRRGTKTDPAASGLSLVISLAEEGPSPSPGGGSSTASSRDTSPCRELSPTITGSLKPPIVLRRAPRGFGFTLRAIRVYLGDSDFYTVHHLVMAVDEGSPALEAGLRPGDLITHINGEAIQGLFHTQVLQLILSEGDKVTLRATPLDQTSIQTGGRRRELAKSRLARRGYYRVTHGAGRRPPGGAKVKAGGASSSEQADRRRKSSLFRRLSSKRASAEIQQSLRLQIPMSAPVLPRGHSSPFLLAANYGGSSSPVLTPSRSFHSLNRSLPSHESGSNSPGSRSSASGYSPPILRHHCQLAAASPASESPRSTPSSSPGSSAPNSPASGQMNSAGPPASAARHFQPHRPSSLHGLKNKLHSVAKNMHSPSRRKSAGHIPLSPLARTPSPSPLPQQQPLPVSPTRSPSPLAFPMQVHHPPGSSHSTQLFSPGASLSVSPAAKQRALSRPKSAEPGSPLLRRALSPDRLHPRSAEKNLVISPLCNACSSSTPPNSSSNGSTTNQRCGLPKVTVISPPRVTILSQTTPEVAAESDSQTKKEEGKPVDPTVATTSSDGPKTVRFESDTLNTKEEEIPSNVKRCPRSRSASPIPLASTPPPDISVEPCVLAAAAASTELRRRKNSSIEEQQQQQQQQQHQQPQPDQVERTSHL
ncbi:microtubule-associated serine/threonine-protein kinase 3-like isoform X5 [Daphnia pulicaria]|uniref:microtubule-associated serine/threonine-protein kinase 3-like isoform X5 n=1 Tax=Daphnia pulicaria TaxID=35523 RepID=UPI001EEBAD62|nr:microtubule-associated serine/threonine-protein kinase 3-like isoform X5 [Daphnia pulicaria]